MAFFVLVVLIIAVSCAMRIKKSALFLDKSALSLDHDTLSCYAMIEMIE